ncbi:MAG: hypothetical protein PVG61_00995 [Dehalococcoidia bacterium]|jgi:hypothetical protein
MIRFIKKLWNGILKFIAWVTQDNARLRKSRYLKPEQEMEIHRIRSQIRRF